MKTIVAHIAQAIVIAAYHVCRLFPVHRRIVMLSRQQNGSTRDFDLLSAYIRDHYPGWTCAILAKKLQNPLAYAPHMLRQVYHIATARAVVLDSYCVAVSLLNTRIHAPVLQMWHALGNMKKFGWTALDVPEGRSSEIARLMHMHEGYDSALVSHKSFASCLAAGFNMDPALLYEAPLPRTDLLVDPEVRAAKRAEILKAFPQLSEKKNIVYCPTWRRTPAPNADQAIAALVDAIDHSRYNFVFKPHPISNQRIDDARVLQGYDRRFDMLYIADYAISDYSTIIYEAGLLEVPLFIYAYDWDSYTEKRGMYIDMERDVPTLFSADPEKIAAAIEADDFDREAYAAFTRNNIAVPAGQTCTQRVAEHLFDMIGHAPAGRAQKRRNAADHV